MKNILNITNGDCAVDAMKKAAVPGEFLPWRDVLHVGPVPDHLSLEELSKIRAGFISRQGWGDAEEIVKSFVERDNTLKSCENFEKVILWFEHDLYDQLQLLQLLDWFHSHKDSVPRLSMICVDRYLGPLPPDETRSLFAYEIEVCETQLELANRAWSAFRSDTPEKWNGLLDEDIGALPFLEGAVVRMLEEYPDRKTGLSRTERQALGAIAEGESHPAKIFARNQELEERIFLGDSVFWDIFNQFLQSSPPLLLSNEGNTVTLPSHPRQKLAITPEGRDVLTGKRNWLEINPPDKWIGGVHLTRADCWYRNAAKRVNIIHQKWHP